MKLNTLTHPLPAFRVIPIAMLLITSVQWSAHATDPGPFLREHCLRCHGADQQQGGRRFDQWHNATDHDRMIDWRDIVDQLTLGDMPPPDESQPPAKARQAIIDGLRENIERIAAKQSSTGGRTVLRRLTRQEYLNTVSDLFQIDMSMFDPTSSFPSNHVDGAFENIGDQLVMSSYLLENYLDAANAIVEKAFRPNAPVQPKRWAFRDGFIQQPELNPGHSEAFDYRYLCLYDCMNADRPEGAYGPLAAMKDGVHADGRYRVRVLAEALNRDTPYPEKELGIELDEPFRLGIVPGDTRLHEQHTMQPIQPILGQQALKDGGPHWYTFEIPLDRGFAPRFVFPNGMASVRPTYVKLVKKYPLLLPESSRDVKGIFLCRKEIIRHGFLPHIRIHEVKIDGPLDTRWPSRSRQAVLGKHEFASEDVNQRLRDFADRAYRRSASDDEVDQLLRVYRNRRSQGHPSEQAFRDAVKAALCSPAFLYLQPVKNLHDGATEHHAIASRLAYFLWRTMPDAELRQLADAGRLRDEAILRSQTRRLLADPRSDRFVEDFLNAWLELGALGDQPPDRKAFASYYADDLKPDMLRESVQFARHLIDHNLPITTFLTADYSFINRDLARLYGVENSVPPDQAAQFKRVRFDDPRRGGLLGQAGVLTATANGIETSPVIRGVWMLERILGTPTPPPPDDVPAIDPDVRGAKSIRDLLEKHRADEACDQCHRKIDPLGFALESFDPIGRWRRRYTNGGKIETQGRLPNGQTFDDIASLKEILVERSPFFARTLTEHLLTFALGRHMEPSDRTGVDQILDELADDGYPMRSLIEQVVTHRLFRQP